MIQEKFNLNVPYDKAGLESDGLNPTLSSFRIDVAAEIGAKKRPAIIVCPGGGYEFVSEREADPVAIRYAAFGIHAFVLRYSVINKPFPTALLEVASAVAFVRSHAEEWDIDPDKIAVCGFSAGGHLAASLATLWNHPSITKALNFTDEHKPNAAILSYPVIVSGPFAHQGSIRNLIGSTPSEDKLELVSLDKQVSSDTPPVFIWHAVDDATVPVENALLFCQALSKYKIYYEAHLYPFGGHGISLCDNTTSREPKQDVAECAGWFDASVHFIKSL